MANQIVRGAVWEAVEDEPQHFYLILTDDSEIVRLMRLCDKKKVTRFRGQITGYGLVRSRRKGE